MGKIRDKTNCTTINIDDTLGSNSLAIGNAFCRYFTSVGRDWAAQIPPSSQHFTKYLGNRQNGSFLLIPTTPHDIISILGRMKGKNSSGHDQISSKLFKAIRGELARVIPLYKAKDKQVLSNYKHISLLVESSSY